MWQVIMKIELFSFFLDKWNAIRYQVVFCVFMLTRGEQELRDQRNKIRKVLEYSFSYLHSVPTFKGHVSFQAHHDTPGLKKYSMLIWKYACVTITHFITLPQLHFKFRFTVCKFKQSCNKNTFHLLHLHRALREHSKRFSPRTHETTEM